MKKCNKPYEYLLVVALITFICITVIKPSVCLAGAKRGLNICANILIPSLFPITVPVLFLINTKVFQRIKRKQLAVFLLSLIGGYPVGARLTCELYNNGEITKTYAKKIIPCLVNAGPAFIVIAVGKGILGSTVSGLILLLSHTLSATVITAILIPGFFNRSSKIRQIENYSALTDNFVSSVHNASNSVISICAFAVLFSVINQYIFFFSDKIPFLSLFIYTTEVTSAVFNTDNIYLISFLLGFAGISIWAQILFVSGDAKPDLLPLLFTRALHGALSTVMTVLFTKVFRLNVQTMSNSVSGTFDPLFTDISVGFSVLLTAIMLFVSISSKKHSGNILKDMV